ncbi:MAG TPA: Mth938-like domain-containing protein [Steroidobacteraceae bacterium]|nr:Mth938-like domain-containing protein [Steroidobacteraceae bacterium]
MTSLRTRVIVSKVKFTLEPPSHANLVRSYSETELRIGAQRVQRSCLVTASRLITDWPPASFDELAPAHLEAIFALTPELVLLGTGPTQRFAGAAVRAEFLRRGIGLEVMQLGAACRTFNVLLQEERRVVAALFLR